MSARSLRERHTDICINQMRKLGEKTIEGGILQSKVKQIQFRTDYK